MSKQQQDWKHAPPPPPPLHPKKKPQPQTKTWITQVWNNVQAQNL